MLYEVITGDQEVQRRERRLELVARDRQELVTCSERATRIRERSPALVDGGSQKEGGWILLRERPFPRIISCLSFLP